MPILASSAPVAEPDIDTRVGTETERPWQTIVWNDPVNLMTYVTFVFRTHFGFSSAVADAKMREVHEQGRSVVASGGREHMERDTEAMHGYGLWATCEPVEGV